MPNLIKKAWTVPNGYIERRGKARHLYFFLFIIQIGEKKTEGNFPSVIHEGWEDLTSLKVRH